MQKWLHSKCLLTEFQKDLQDKENTMQLQKNLEPGALSGYQGLLFRLGSETDLKSLEIFHTPNCIYYYF